MRRRRSSWSAPARTWRHSLRATAALLAQVQSLDGEVGALARSLRVEGGSPGGVSREDASREDASQAAPAAEEKRETPLPAALPAAAELPDAMPLRPGAAAGEEERETASPGESAAVAEEVPETVPQRSEDLDGARLVALNMALSGESREQTDRYLADSFQLSDRAKLLDEVYAAVEG